LHSKAFSVFNCCDILRYFANLCLFLLYHCDGIVMDNHAKSNRDKKKQKESMGYMQ